MSRVAKQPVSLPQGVTATISAEAVTVKGGKGTLSLPLNALHVRVVQEASVLKVEKASEGREAYRTHPMDLWIPSLFIATLVLCANFIADGLRDALDPRTRES